MKLNYKEGMFLGKQELERQSLIENSLADSLFQMLRHSVNEFVSGSSPATDFGAHGGVLSPRKIGLKVVETEAASHVLKVYVEPRFSENRNKIGRAIVGVDASKNLIGLPVLGGDWSWTGKESQVSVDIDEISPDSNIAFLILVPSTTHYENALISIDSNGVGTLTVNPQVISMFRSATGGRASTIKTENNQILRVASINTGNNTIQFEGTSFTAESNVRFMFVQTLSPFVTDTPEPLYTYPSCSPIIVYDLDEYMASSPGDEYGYLLAAKITYDEDYDTLYQAESDLGLDFVGYHELWGDRIYPGSITSSELSNGAVRTNNLGYGAVTTPKIEDSAVTRAKLGLNSWGYRGVIEDRQDQHETIYFEPGLIGVIYNYNNVANDRILKPRIPSGFTEEMALLQPTKIILRPESSPNPSYSELRQFFSTYGTGISLEFPNSMEGVTPGEFIYEIFDIFWISLTKAVVMWNRVNIEW